MMCPRGASPQTPACRERPRRAPSTGDIRGTETPCYRSAHCDMHTRLALGFRLVGLREGLVPACVALGCLALGPLSVGCGDSDPLILPGPGGTDGGGRGGTPSENGGSDSGSGGTGNAAGSAGGGSAGSGGSGSATGGASNGGSGGTAEEPGVTTPVNPPGSTAPIGIVVPDDEAQAWVFDESAVHTYELTLDPAVWTALQASARDE